MMFVNVQDHGSKKNNIYISGSLFAYLNGNTYLYVSIMYITIKIKITSRPLPFNFTGDPRLPMSLEFLKKPSKKSGVSEP